MGGLGPVPRRAGLGTHVCMVAAVSQRHFHTQHGDCSPSHTLQGKLLEMGPLVPGRLSLVLDICVRMPPCTLHSFKKHHQALPTEHGPRGRGCGRPTVPGRVQAEAGAQHGGASAAAQGARGSSGRSFGILCSPWVFRTCWKPTSALQPQSFPLDQKL